MQALRFDETDLAANRQNQLSTRQRQNILADQSYRFVDRKRAITLSVALAVALLLLLLAQESLEKSLTYFAIAYVFFWCTGAILIVIPMWETLKVHKTSGELRIYKDDEDKTPPKGFLAESDAGGTGYTLQVNNIKIFISSFSYRQSVEFSGAYCTLYYFSPYYRMRLPFPKPNMTRVLSIDLHPRDSFSTYS